MSTQLSQQGRDAIHAFAVNMARAYGVNDVRESFAVEPSLAQTLNEKIVEQGGHFLSQVNVIPVNELKGEKVLMSLTGPVSARTDTTVKDRSPKNLIGLSNKLYELFKTESDVAITYSQIDTWAKFKNFAQMYMTMVRKAIANDRVRVGWIGTSVAVETDPANNLTDLNIGWLQLLRDFNGGVQVADQTIQLGGATHPNLDIIVHDLIGMIDPIFQNDPDLIAYVSRDLINAAQGDYYEQQGTTPSEKEKIKQQRVYQTYGGLPAQTPPFFPDGKILITTPKNLSIYWQQDSWRRKLDDNAKRDQYEDYNSRNEGYVVEEERIAALADDVTIK